MSTTPIDFSSVGGQPVSSAIDFSSVGGTSLNTKPGFGENASDVVLGTKSPWEQAKSEWNQFVNDPVGSLGQAAKQVAMAPVYGAYNLVHHPIDTVTGLTGGPQFTKAADDKNVPGMAGALVGGAVNALPLLAGAAEGVNNIASARAIPLSTDANVAKQMGATVPGAADLQAPARAANDFKNAVPPTKSTPYTVQDYQRARGYLEDEHVQTNIQDPESLRDAADTAIEKIEGKISDYIQANPRDLISSKPLDDAKAALSENARGQAFVKAGLKELADFNLDQPKTVAEADDIRRQLNAENKAVLKKNNYDVATARAADPTFAAREAAAESLRNGIYDQLSARGIDGARQLRQDEGALIKIRNAAQGQLFNGDKRVAASALNSPTRDVAGRLGQAALTGGGAYLGSTIGPAGTVAGSIIGAGAGELAQRFFKPEALTRSELLQRSFEGKNANPPTFPQIPNGRPGVALGSLAPRNYPFAGPNGDGN
jgi:hypothetical protein